MNKYQHWYIRGWEYENRTTGSGHMTRELVYRGEYYRPYLKEEQFRGLKIQYTVLLAVVYAVYLLFSLRGSGGGRVVYAGAGCILAIVPLIFQGMGVFSLWTAPYKMPFRNYYAAVLRTRVASAVTAGLLGISVVGEVVFMLLHRGDGLNWLNEMLWLCGCAVCGGISFFIFYRLYELHFDILPGQVDTSGMKRCWNAKKKS